MAACVTLYALFAPVAADSVNSMPTPVYRLESHMVSGDIPSLDDCSEWLKTIDNAMEAGFRPEVEVPSCSSKPLPYPAVKCVKGRPCESITVIFKRQDGYLRTTVRSEITGAPLATLAGHHNFDEDRQPLPCSVNSKRDISECEDTVDLTLANMLKSHTKQYHSTQFKESGK